MIIEERKEKVKKWKDLRAEIDKKHDELHDSFNELRNEWIQHCFNAMLSNGLLDRESFALLLLTGKSMVRNKEDAGFILGMGILNCLKYFNLTPEEWKEIEAKADITKSYIDDTCKKFHPL